MNEIITQNEIAISSRSIAQMTGKKHGHVKRDIENMLIVLDIDESKIGRTYKDSQNRTQTEYILQKREALILASGYDIRLRALIIDELEKLQNSQLPQLPQNYKEALIALVSAEEEKEKLQLSVKNKDEVILAVADLNIKAGDVSVGDFAKNLALDGLGRNNMYTWLKGRGFLGINNEPYQRYVERGYFKRKPYEEKYGGEIKYKTVLTPRGTVWLSKIIRAEFECEEA